MAVSCTSVLCPPVFCGVSDVHLGSYEEAYLCSSTGVQMQELVRDSQGSVGAGLAHHLHIHLVAMTSLLAVLLVEVHACLVVKVQNGARRSMNLTWPDLIAWSTQHTTSW